MSPERLRSVLPADRFEAFERGVHEAHELLDGRVVWNVNSTARGGGVVELLVRSSPTPAGPASTRVGS